MTEQHSPHHQQQHPQQQQGLQQVPPVSTGSGKQAHGLGALGRMAGKVAKGSFQVVASGAKAATHAASNVANVAGSGLGAISSSGQGFRDFILRSNVVDLAVAVVIGMAFTSLIEAFTKDFITPAMGAVFAGTNLTDLSFTVNGSQFMYGHFIAAVIVFLLIVLVLYYLVVNPLQKLMYSVYKNKALRRDCPYCLEEIALLATRCKYCAGVINPTPEEIEAMSKAVSASNLPKIHCSHLTRCFQSRAAAAAAANDLEQAAATEQQDLMQRFMSVRQGSSLRALSTLSRGASFVSASERLESLDSDVEAQILTPRVT